MIDLTGVATGTCTNQAYVQVRSWDTEGDTENEVVLSFLGEGSSGFGSFDALPAIAEGDVPSGELTAEVDLVMGCDTDGAATTHQLTFTWDFDGVVAQEKLKGGLPIVYVP